jgi:hypothetical protein
VVRFLTEIPSVSETMNQLDMTDHMTTKNGKDIATKWTRSKKIRDLYLVFEKMAMEAKIKWQCNKKKMLKKTD